MKSRNLIDIFVKKKIKDKKIKIKISNKTDLFINSIFDSLDFAEFNNFIENEGYYLDLKKNKFRIPRSKSEIVKIIRDRRKIKSDDKIKENRDFKSNFFKILKKRLKLNSTRNLIIHSNFTNMINLGIKPEDFISGIFNFFPSITIFSPSGFFRERKIKLNSLKKIKPNNEFGLLSKELLKRFKPKIFRNNNPFDNLIGYNRKKKYFDNKNYLAYGKDSPYRKLLNQNTSIMLLDVTFFYNSMFHMAELDANVPYRNFKKFTFNKKEFQLFARNREKLYLDYSKFEKIKEIKKITKVINFKKIKIRIINYKSLYKTSLKLLKKNPNFLLN